MSDLGKRLDQLAAAASRGSELRDPSRGATAARPVPTRALAFGIVGALAVAAMLFLWQGGDNSTSLVTAQEPTDQTAVDQSQCRPAKVLEVLRAGIPAYDYDPAGSYLELFDASPIFVSGRVTSVARATTNGRDFIELSLADVVDLADIPQPDVAVIAYDAVWADRSQPDPLAAPVAFTDFDVEFVGFLTPWSGVRGGWTPGAEGLYISCARNAPLVAVMGDAAGADDPVAPTVAELRNFLSTEFNQREAVRRAEEAQQAAEEQARIRAEEQALIDREAVVAPANLTEARERWATADIGDYRFTVNVLGVEGTSTSVQLTVRGGRPALDVVIMQGRPNPPVWSVEDLFDLAESADVLSDINFDAELGYPTLLRIDPDQSVGGDDLVIMVTELFALSDIDAAEFTLEQWLPEPIVITEELQRVVRGPKPPPIETLYQLHEHPDVDVFLYQDGEQVCLSAASTAASEPGRYSGSQSSCSSQTDFFLRGMWLSAGGGDDEAAMLVVVPPLAYFDEDWTFDVDSSSEFDTLLTARSALIVFDRDAPPESGPARVRCDCGDLAYAFIVD